MKIQVINGPNLNMLGVRSPELYGRVTLAELDELCQQAGAELGVEVQCFQSNAEAELIERIHQCYASGADPADGIVINPAAYTHTSVAIADALEAVALPVCEVHLSNVFAREAFRHHSYVSPLAEAVFAGCGPAGYRYAIQHLAQLGGN